MKGLFCICHIIKASSSKHRLYLIPLPHAMALTCLRFVFASSFSMHGCSTVIKLCSGFCSCASPHPPLCYNIITHAEAGMNFILLYWALRGRGGALEPVQNLLQHLGCERRGMAVGSLKMIMYEKDTESWQGLCRAWWCGLQAGAQLHGGKLRVHPKNLFVTMNWMCPCVISHNNLQIFYIIEICFVSWLKFVFWIVETSM